MTTEKFDFASVFKSGLPSPEALWTGFPQFNFVGGHNDPESFPLDDIIDAARAVLKREGRTLATYCLESGPQGYLPLREFLVEKLKRDSGITCSANDIMLTSGSLQAIDLINDVLLESGDTVIVEQSNYGGVLSRLKRLNVNVQVVPVDTQGMRTDMLAETLNSLADKGLTPQYIYTIPTIHNPTGAIMSEVRRAELLELAERYRVPVFEDECYADLIWDRTRPAALYAMSTDKRVIHIGSFSKSVAPALRVGYVVADWDVISQLLACKHDAGSGALEQMVLAEYCSKHFDDHISRLNNALKTKLGVLVDSLNEHFGTATEFDIPKGGIFLWVRFPETVDTARLFKAAIDNGVAVNPGVEWAHELPDANRRVRLCFANPSHEQIRNGISRLAEICHKETGIPRHISNVEREGAGKTQA